MADPHRCPVCEGRGDVPAGFYGDGEPSVGRQTCRSCGGRGWVSVAEEAATPGPESPLDLTYRTD